MERNYDEVIAEILIHLDQLEDQLEKVESRMDLTVKRISKVESRLEFLSKKQDISTMAFQDFISMQSKLNKYFLDYIEKIPIK